MESKKNFGLFSIVLLGINAIIGSGIFLLPGNVYKSMGTSSLFVYLFIRCHYDSSGIVRELYPACYDKYDIQVQPVHSYLSGCHCF